MGRGQGAVVDAAADANAATAGVADRRSQHTVLRLLAVRLVGLVATLLIVSLLVFAATQALPGDPARAVLGMTATPERTAVLREQLGLNQPLADQYVSWLGGIVHGDLGRSAISPTPVIDMISSRVTNSLWLMLAVVVVAVPVSVVLALVAASREGGWFDRVVNVVAMGLTALPEFVVGIATVALLATSVFHFFPAVSVIYGGDSVVASPNVVVLPALTLTVLVVPYLVRLVRASAVEVMESEYVRAAALRGVRGRRLLLRHVLPNVAPPTLQAVVLTIVYLLGGVVVVETVFSYPGMGLALVESVRLRDLPTIQALVMVIAAVYLVLTAVADALTVVLTPKLRTARR